jgi:hypothetical protein
MIGMDFLERYDCIGHFAKRALYIAEKPLSDAEIVGYRTEKVIPVQALAKRVDEAVGAAVGALNHVAFVGAASSMVVPAYCAVSFPGVLLNKDTNTPICVKEDLEEWMITPDQEKLGEKGLVSWSSVCQVKKPEHNGDQCLVPLRVVNPTKRAIGLMKGHKLGTAQKGGYKLVQPEKYQLHPQV